LLPKDDAQVAEILGRALCPTDIFDNFSKYRTKRLAILVKKAIN
jgi:hypothetical protein